MIYSGWSDHMDDNLSEQKSVTFQDESKSPSSQTFPKADRIIQSIKLDRFQNEISVFARIRHGIHSQ